MLEWGTRRVPGFVFCFMGKSLRKALCSVAAVQHVTEWTILRAQSVSYTAGVYGKQAVSSFPEGQNSPQNWWVGQDLAESPTVLLLSHGPCAQILFQI